MISQLPGPPTQFPQQMPLLWWALSLGPLPGVGELLECELQPERGWGGHEQLAPVHPLSGRVPEMPGG